MPRRLARREWLRCTYCGSDYIVVGERWIAESRFCRNECRYRWHTEQRRRDREAASA